MTTLRISLTFRSGFSHRGLDVLHQKEQVERIGWAGFKLPLEVPQSGRLVLGMHQQCTNPGNVCRLCSAQQRIFEQCFAKPCALVLKVHGKPGQNHHRHRVLWNAFGHTRCRIGWLHTANRQAGCKSLVHQGGRLQSTGQPATTSSVPRGGQVLQPLCDRQHPRAARPLR